MALNISAWSIRHPVTPIVMAAAIVALGFISFTKLPITRMPNVDVPLITVTISQFGAAPGELEGQVTKKVEDAVAGVAGAHHISSTITDLIAQGRLGMKTKGGIFDYTDEQIEQLRAQRFAGLVKVRKALSS